MVSNYSSNIRTTDAGAQLLLGVAWYQWTFTHVNAMHAQLLRCIFVM